MIKRRLLGSFKDHHPISVNLAKNLNSFFFATISSIYVSSKEQGVDIFGVCGQHSPL